MRIARDDLAVETASFRSVLTSRRREISIREERPKGPLYVTMTKAYIKEGLHADQLFEKLGEGAAWEISLSSGRVYSC